MFDVGDIVFVRLEGYPVWPAKVIPPTQDHLANLQMDKIPSNERLVLFFNDNGLYASIETTDLRPIDDPRLQKRTTSYQGRDAAKLRVAFKQALDDHQPSKPPSTSQKKHRKTRKKPPPSRPSHPTSPVTGHSDLRQAAPHQPTNTLLKPSKPTSTSPSSIPPTLTSPTPPAVSISTPPSRSPQSPSVPVPAKIRVRHKRTAAAIHTPLQSPHSHMSSPSPTQTLSQSSPKRTRRDTNTKPNYLNQSQTEQSNPNHLDPPKPHTLPVLPNESPESTKPQIQTPVHPPAKSENLSADAHVTAKSTRISRSRSALRTRPKKDNPKVSRGSKPPSKTLPIKSRLDTENNADKTHFVRKRQRSSRVKPAELSHSDDESDTNGSSSSEREERATDIRNSRARGNSRRMSDLNIVQSNTVERESDYGEKPSKRRKVDESRESASVALDALSEKDSSEVIERMMNTIRFLHVEKWQDGYKRAGARDIMKTEKEMWARCKAAIQKAEKLLRIMKGEQKRDELKVTAEEQDTFQAVRDLRDIYFDVKTMNLRKVGAKLMSLGRELGRYSTLVWSAIREVLVMWGDLTTENVNEDVQERDERTATKKERSSSYRGRADERRAMPEAKSKSRRKTRERKKEDEEHDEKVVETGGDIADSKRKVLTTEASGDKKERSAREERLMKFDREKVVVSVDTILKGAQGDLDLDERERRRFTRDVEDAIEPRFEDDRSGYYEASVKVMRALKRALKDLRTHGSGDTNKGAHQHTKMLVGATQDKTGEQAKLLVACLLR